MATTNNQYLMLSQLLLKMENYNPLWFSNSPVTFKFDSVNQTSQHLQNSVDTITVYNVRELANQESNQGKANINPLFLSLGIKLMPPTLPFSRWVHR